MVEISTLVNTITNVKKIEQVEEDELLEGLNGIWIDFGNGVVIGMYADVNYGNIQEEISEVGSPYYYFPRDFRKNIISLLEENQ